MMLTAAFALSLIVNVSAPADVPASVVTDALVEANAIWRPSGTSFVWRRDSTLPAPLRVIISRATLAATTAALPLGWVVFDAGAPEAEIHLSYSNVEQLFEESRNTIIHSTTRTTTQFEHHTMMAAHAERPDEGDADGGGVLLAWCPAFRDHAGAAQ